MIPDEAVEAAWRAMPPEDYVTRPDQVREMLEAALPYLIPHERTSSSDST